MQETQVQFLGGEDPLEKEMANSLQYSVLGNPIDRGAWRASLQGCKNVGHNLVAKQQHCLLKIFVKRIDFIHFHCPYHTHTHTQTK